MGDYKKTKMRTDWQKAHNERDQKIQKGRKSGVKDGEMRYDMQKTEVQCKSAGFWQRKKEVEA